MEKQPNKCLGVCMVHGIWENTTVECPKCIESNYDHIPELCKGCTNANWEDAICESYQKPFKIISPNGTKKRCKYFENDFCGEDVES